MDYSSFLQRRREVATATVLIIIAEQLMAQQRLLTFAVADYLHDSLPTALCRGRYKSSGVFSRDTGTFWQNILEHGDAMEFYNFIGITRESFVQLAAVLKPSIEALLVNQRSVAPRRCDLARRRFTHIDVTAIVLKYLTSKAELKNLSPQFGCIVSVFHDYLNLGMDAVLEALIMHDLAKVFWDRSDDALDDMKDISKSFPAAPGVVAVIDGLKLISHAPALPAEQNRDFNGWTKDVNRNLVLVWNLKGRVVDCAVNTPGSFHDSTSCVWAHIYEHIMKLPKGTAVAADAAFSTAKNLKGKVIKVKKSKQHKHSAYNSTLTHLRQCAEWGNHTLTATFRRLLTPLPTDNIRRGRIMWSSILLHNWKTETCDRNQIRTYLRDVSSKL